MSKDQYIELINQLLESCNDIDALDLIYKIAASTVNCSVCHSL
jgi:hypothetical protein